MLVSWCQILLSFIHLVILIPKSAFFLAFGLRATTERLIIHHFKICVVLFPNMYLDLSICSCWAGTTSTKYLHYTNIEKAITIINTVGGVWVKFIVTLVFDFTEKPSLSSHTLVLSVKMAAEDDLSINPKPKLLWSFDQQKCVYLVLFREGLKKMPHSGTLPDLVPN